MVKEKVVTYRQQVINQAVEEGISPLEVMLRSMRALWNAATSEPALDVVMTMRLAALPRKWRRICIRGWR